MCQPDVILEDADTSQENQDTSANVVSSRSGLSDSKTEDVPMSESEAHGMANPEPQCVLRRETHSRDVIVIEKGGQGSKTDIISNFSHSQRRTPRLGRIPKI